MRYIFHDLLLCTIYASCHVSAAEVSEIGTLLSKLVYVSVDFLNITPPHLLLKLKSSMITNPLK